MQSPLKWPGGKHYLAKKIIALMPPHIHYVEPYAGSLAVLLAKDPEGISEVVNDLNGELVNFWRVLRNNDWFTKFVWLAQATPFSEELWQSFTTAQLPEIYHPAKRAWEFFVRCRQSLAGRMTDFAAVSKNRTRRGMNEQVAAWLTAVEGLPEVHTRMKRVLILNHHATDLICEQDGPQTLCYLDPPYLHETRVTTTEYGRFEMTEADHKVLLHTITDPRRQSRFLLSGYRNPIYEAWLAKWTRHDFEMPNHASGAKTKPRMVESVWTNF